MGYFYSRGWGTSIAEDGVLL